MLYDNILSESFLQTYSAPKSLVFHRCIDDDDDFMVKNTHM